MSIVEGHLLADIGHYLRPNKDTMTLKETV